LSSAILYVAIVAIWAGVLIPRWLRRDTSASEQAADETSTPASAADPAAAEERPRPSRARPREDDAPRARRPVVPGARRTDVPDARRTDVPDARRSDVEAAREEAGMAREDDRETGEQEHARVLSSRRRLLGLLLALTAGSAALAFTRTAAWWVIMPPTVMLVGYLGLLREASKADAERRELLLARAVEAAATAAAAPAPVPVPVPAPEAEIIKFSPAQNVAAEQDQEFYDQYADAKLRAVGDLSGGRVERLGAGSVAG
jgi:hypothetical protein